MPQRLLSTDPLVHCQAAEKPKALVDPKRATRKPTTAKKKKKKKKKGSKQKKMFKCLATSATLLVTVALVMTIIISVIEDWVRVGLKGEKFAACSSDTQPIGTLGLYSATYDPACVAKIEDPEAKDAAGSFTIFAATKSSTTEFWPLFPAQTAFATSDDGFTNCKDYFLEGSANETASKLLVGLLDGGIKSLDSKLPAQYEVLRTEFGNIFSMVDQQIAGLWATQVSSNAALIVGGFQQQVKGLADLLSLIYSPNAETTSLQSLLVEDISADFCARLPMNCTASVPDQPYRDTISTVIGILHMMYNNAGASSVSSPVQLPPVNTSAFSSTDMIPDLLFNFNVANAFEAGPISTAQVATIANIFTRIAIAANSTEAITSSFGAFSLAGFCVSSGASTFDECGQVFSKLNSNLTADWALCNFAAQSTTFGSAIQAAKKTVSPDTCSAQTLLQALVFAAQGDPTSAPLPLPLLEMFMKLINGCATYSKLWTTMADENSCQNFILNPTGDVDDQDGIPADMSTPFVLCSGLVSAELAKGKPPPTCENFEDFVTLLANGDDPELQKLAPIASMYSNCASQGMYSTSMCFTVASKMFSELAKSVMPMFYANTSTVYEWIERCEEDEDDASRIKLAQALIPLSIAIKSVALILLVAYLPSQKKALGATAGTLAILATVISLTALLKVRNAPVYQAVGKPCADGQTCYVNGSANLYAMFSIFLPALGGVLALASLSKARKTAPVAVDQ